MEDCRKEGACELGLEEHQGRPGGPQLPWPALGSSGLGGVICTRAMPDKSGETRQRRMKGAPGLGGF